MLSSWQCGSLGVCFGRSLLRSARTVSAPRPMRRLLGLHAGSWLLSVVRRAAVTRPQGTRPSPAIQQHFCLQDWHPVLTCPTPTHTVVSGTTRTHQRQRVAAATASSSSSGCFQASELGNHQGPPTAPASSSGKRHNTGTGRGSTNTHCLEAVAGNWPLCWQHHHTTTAAGWRRRCRATPAPHHQLQ